LAAERVREDKIESKFFPCRWENMKEYVKILERFCVAVKIRWDIEQLIRCQEKTKLRPCLSDSNFNTRIIK
jgi:hypothetical protein